MYAVTENIVYGTPRAFVTFRTQLNSHDILLLESWSCSERFISRSAELIDILLDRCSATTAATLALRISSDICIYHRHDGASFMALISTQADQRRHL